MFNVGDFVKVKKGVRDPDFDEIDISNWQGEVIEIEDEDYLLIKWDNITLNEMPEESLEMSLLEGLDASQMFLHIDDLELTEARPQVPLIDRDFNSMEDEEKRIAKIIGDDDFEVTLENLENYRKYLIENLDFSTVVTGTEDFPWEEKYVFGYGDKNEYKRLKKTRPSYRDLYKIFEIEEHIDDHVGLVVRVKRLSDRKFFELPLADLKANDKKSAAFELLSDYSFWFVNYR